MIEISFIVMAVSLGGFAFSLLYLMKEIKVLIVWSIALTVVEIAVYYMGYELKWYVLGILPFYLFSVAYMLVKVRRRVHAAIKRIDEREEKERQALQATEDKSVQCKEASHGK
jgi:hypothetical protein